MISGRNWPTTLQAHVEPTDLVLMSDPVVVLLCHLRMSSACSRGAPDPGCWFLPLGWEQI